VTRFFVLTGAPTPADLIDRAAAHGTAGRAVAHDTPHPTGVYGCVEITPHADGRDDGEVGE
jgi:hypothetical protein